MVQVIDLDQKIKADNVVKAKIAGKEYPLVFDDNFSKISAQTYLAVSNAFKDVSQPELLDESENAQRNTVTKTIKDAREISIKCFDKLLGKGEGKRLWNYYNHSTNALATILGMLADEAQNSIGVKNSKAKKIKHYKAPNLANNSMV